MSKKYNTLQLTITLLLISKKKQLFNIPYEFKQIIYNKMEIFIKINEIRTIKNK